MDYFQKLLHLLKIEKQEDRKQFQQLTATLPITERRENGMTWYPVAIKDTELGRGDYLSVEIERTTHQDIMHQIRFGMTAALFSNHDPREDRVEGTITHISGNRLKLSVRTDELPDWSRYGKLGIDAVFDENSYQEMENALKQAATIIEKKDDGQLARILISDKQPTFHTIDFTPTLPILNESQKEAVKKIITGNELAIVHGPPGTGKTTTLVHAIKALIQHKPQRVLVVAPSNAAVDLLSDKLSQAGLNVVRVGNPARVNERQLELTLDHKISSHSSNKEIKRLRKLASEYRDMAQKYKRSFGPAEREQRKALFAEARKVMKEVEDTEQYISKDVISKADVITATLVGANHYSVRTLKYETVFIDEAGQSIEPACWIPILKAQKLVMAGDHWQLPPTIKSAEAAKELSITLFEKCITKYRDAVVLLEQQYRMHNDIMHFSSKEFYSNQLVADASVAEEVLFQGDQPLLFIDTAGCGYEEANERTSISNPEEASFLLKHLVHYTNELRIHYKTENFPSIAVISPYRHQVELLKEAFAHHAELKDIAGSVSVNTIDSFQGQERDIVYISLTRSNSDNTIGFLSEVRRMNVAMTRAKKKLVVIGDSSTLASFPFYADFISYTEEKGAYKSAWEFMDQ
jgi:superfamily I DNA and/or RNA helicase